MPAGLVYDRGRRYRRGERQGLRSIADFPDDDLFDADHPDGSAAKRFQKMFLVISVAPLGLIGVVMALLPTGTPMGFVAILGIIALSGMIIRNSVILIDQIDMDFARGPHPWEAVINATIHPLRPIVLTAAAASLGMIPIASEVFWGPMAYAIIGGLFVATLLTLLFLPALYVAWFRVKEPAKEREVEVAEPAPAGAL